MTTARDELADALARAASMTDEANAIAVFFDTRFAEELGAKMLAEPELEMEPEPERRPRWGRVGGSWHCHWCEFCTDSSKAIQEHRCASPPVPPVDTGVPAVGAPDDESAPERITLYSGPGEDSSLVSLPDPETGKPRKGERPRKYVLEAVAEREAAELRAHIEMAQGIHQKSLALEVAKRAAPALRIQGAMCHAYRERPDSDNLDPAARALLDEMAELRGLTARSVELLEEAAATEAELRREMYALRERITEYANERDAAVARVNGCTHCGTTDAPLYCSPSCNDCHTAPNDAAGARKDADKCAGICIGADAAAPVDVDMAGLAASNAALRSHVDHWEEEFGRVVAERTALEREAAELRRLVEVQLDATNSALVERDAALKRVAELKAALGTISLMGDRRTDAATDISMAVRLATDALAPPADAQAEGTVHRVDSKSPEDVVAFEAGFAKGKGRLQETIDAIRDGEAFVPRAPPPADVQAGQSGVCTQCGDIHDRPAVQTEAPKVGHPVYVNAASVAAASTYDTEALRGKT